MHNSILKLLFIAFFTMNFSSFAQVGVGTTSPESSAALDVSATDKGLMIPRVSLTDVTDNTTPINLPATGLLIYNINATVTGGNGTGYYYWNSSQWEKLITAASANYWQLNGNAGTNPATDFVGTSDAEDLVVRSNNTERMRIQSDGDVGIGNTNPTHDLDLTGSFRIQGDFINQQTIGNSTGAVQDIPFTNAVFTPLNGTTTSITVTDGNGVNNSAVFISGFARVFGGNLDGANSSLGGYFIILERDDNPGFTSPTFVTYTAGSCYIETPDSGASASIGYGSGGHVSYLDTGLVGGATYYYRLTFYPNGASITSGTYTIFQRSLSVLQIKQ